MSGIESPQISPPEPTDPPREVAQRAEPVLEGQLVDLISSEPVVPYQSPISPRTQPTASKEMFSKENVSSVSSVTAETCQSKQSDVQIMWFIVMVNWGVMLL